MRIVETLLNKTELIDSTYINAEWFTDIKLRNIVKAIRAEEGNEKYDYYFPLEDPESLLLIDRWKDEEAIEKHHKSEMMAQINELRKKYKLKMKVERFTDLP